MLGSLNRQPVRFGLEQPEEPIRYMLQVVSFWRTPEWLALRELYKFEE